MLIPGTISEDAELRVTLLSRFWSAKLLGRNMFKKITTELAKPAVQVAGKSTKKTPKVRLGDKIQTSSTKKNLPDASHSAADLVEKVVDKTTNSTITTNRSSVADSIRPGFSSSVQTQSRADNTRLDHDSLHNVYSRLKYWPDKTKAIDAFPGVYEMLLDRSPKDVLLYHAEKVISKASTIHDAARRQLSSFDGRNHPTLRDLYLWNEAGSQQLGHAVLNHLQLPAVAGGKFVHTALHDLRAFERKIDTLLVKNLSLRPRSERLQEINQVFVDSVRESEPGKTPRDHVKIMHTMAGIIAQLSRQNNKSSGTSRPTVVRDIETLLTDIEKMTAIFAGEIGKETFKSDAHNTLIWVQGKSAEFKAMLADFRASPEQAAEDLRPLHAERAKLEDVKEKYADLVHKMSSRSPLNTWDQNIKESLGGSFGGEDQIHFIHAQPASKFWSTVFGQKAERNMVM